MSATVDVIKQESVLVARKPLHLVMPLLFFFLVGMAFPLASYTNSEWLQRIAPGVIWVAVLLAHLLSLPQLFARDHKDGFLDQLLIRSSSLWMNMFIRVMVHWLFFIFPLILLTPILACMYHLSFSVTKILMLSLLLGTPVIVMQGAVVAAVSVVVARESLLLAIVLLPLYIPILIFGASVTTAALQGFSVFLQLDLLAAFFILAMTFGPALIAYALRVGITYS